MPESEDHSVEEVLDALIAGSNWASEHGFEDLAYSFGKLYQEFASVAINDGGDSIPSEKARELYEEIHGSEGLNQIPESLKESLDEEPE